MAATDPASSARLDRRALAEALLSGLVIPAHPLALTADRRLDERRQVALTRYYSAAGAGGVAVGVHTTQFAIRQAGLLEHVLRLAASALDERRSERRLVRVAGAIGPTLQAVAEAELARGLGYDAILLSLSALREATLPELLEHCRQVAEVLPLFGFYLQTAVGGRPLDHRFWRGFLEIENVVAIKVAPFNRYQTMDVVRALAESGRSAEVALYTGNDDAIVFDLLADFAAALDPERAGSARVQFAGGLLGQWAVWTRKAVELLEAVKECRRNGCAGTLDLLALGQRLTDANGALFDVRNGFAGCIAGVNEVLRRQGLLANRLCLDPHEDLSPGQSDEIDRVSASYPELVDDAFVAEHRDEWLR
jgi:dihydrodipicolinate synthase/N-acetylneuraminate lyase